MAKKQQHFVPKIYLKAFLDPNLPPDWPEGRPFTPAVWVQDPTLTGKPKRRAPSHSVFKDNHLYTLANDDPKHPKIEDALSELESAFSRAQKKIVAHELLSLEEYKDLCLFAASMFGRIPEQMDHWQQQIDEIEHLYRQMASKEVADEYWSGSDEAGKRSILGMLAGYAELLSRHGFLLVNKSNIPFISSDRPMAHVFLHIDEPPLCFFPAWYHTTDATSVKEFFAFLPISPSVAFVSSPLLDTQGYYLWTDDPGFVLGLNELTRHRAVNIIISDRAHPYGEFTDAIIQLENRARAEYHPPKGILIYSETKRFWIPASSIEFGSGVHPLNGRVSFIAKALKVLREAADTETITEVLIENKDGSGGGMRDCWFTSVAIAPNTPTVIENGPGGWERWSGRSNFKTDLD